MKHFWAHIHRNFFLIFKKGYLSCFALLTLYNYYHNNYYKPGLTIPNSKLQKINKEQMFFKRSWWINVSWQHAPAARIILARICYGIVSVLDSFFCMETCQVSPKKSGFLNLLVNNLSLGSGNRLEMDVYSP